MKKLTIVRHAKSSWKYDVSDRERPLKKRGINDINLVSEYFKENNIPVDLICSSPANRALTTCKMFMDILNLNHEMLKIDEAIYDFSGNSLTKFIKSLPINYNNIMIFGHNHAITSFVNKFGTKTFNNVPTCGLVSIEFYTNNWNDISQGKTVDYIFPKMLK